MFRFLFPSFEKPVEQRPYVNLEPESHEFSGVGVVLLLAASCGVALALWEPSHQVTSPFVTASPQRAAPAVASKAASQETTAAAEAAAEADDDQVAPTVKLSTLCSQRATARRDCAGVKALKDARLKPAEPDPVPAKETKPATVAAKASKPDQAEPLPATSLRGGDGRNLPAPAQDPAVSLAPPAVSPTQQRSTTLAGQAPAATAAQNSPVAQAEAPAAQPQPQKTASISKSKRQRPIPDEVERLVRDAPVEAKRQRAVPAEVERLVREAPVERLVRVYDQVTPDGRRVPVYRRVGSGSYETGVVVDGEYRPARRVEAGTRYFGLQ